MEFIYDYQKMLAVEATKHSKLKSDLRKLVEKWPESIPTDEVEKLLDGGE